jgi:hypothetical protein
VRRYIVFFTLCLIFFVLPLQIYIMGDFTGIGVQGAVYRYQTSGYGTFFIPLTREITFVLNGTLSGRTALSVILWVSGTLLMAYTTIFAFLHVLDTTENYYRQVAYGLITSCGIYLGSCIAQYGFLLKGLSGFSLPVGIIAIPCWILILHYYRYATKKNRETPKNHP